MTKFVWGSALLIAAVFSTAGWVTAQEEEGAPRRSEEARPVERQADTDADPATATRQPGQRREGQSNRTDYFLATCLLIDNQAEATIGQFAQTRAESDEVRQFAEKMAQEHQQAAEMLTRLAQAGPESRDAAAPRDPAAPRTDAPREGAEATRPATPRPSDSVTASQAQLGGQRGGGGGQFFVNLKRELAEQCVQSAQKELGAKKGEEFDKCYIGSQIMAHQHMLDALTVFEKHAQGEELKSTIAKAKPMAQAHLDEAKAIAKKLEGKAEGETSSGAKKSAKTSDTETNEKASD